MDHRLLDRELDALRDRVLLLGGDARFDDAHFDDQYHRPLFYEEEVLEKGRSQESEFRIQNDKAETNFNRFLFFFSSDS